MASAQRMRISRALKTAVCAGVLGLIGSVMVPATQASLVTFELVPTSSSNGTVAGNNVALTGPGTVNFNIVAVLHSTNATQADDGLGQAPLSILSDSGGALGTLSLSNIAPFNGSTAQAGTPTGTPPGVDIGSDRGTASGSDTTTDFYAQTPSNSAQLGTATTAGDLSQIIGTGVFNVTASSGSTTVVPVLHIDGRVSGITGFPPSTAENYKFQLDGNTYALDGNGKGVSNGAGIASPDASSLGVQGFNVTVGTPEPGTFGLAAIGGLGLLLRRRRK